jgi:uncharacterized protein YqcC (DUF446 family)
MLHPEHLAAMRREGEQARRDLQDIQHRNQAVEAVTPARGWEPPPAQQERRAAATTRAPAMDTATQAAWVRWVDSHINKRLNAVMDGMAEAIGEAIAKAAHEAKQDRAELLVRIAALEAAQAGRETEPLRDLPSLKAIRGGRSDADR